MRKEKLIVFTALKQTKIFVINKLNTISKVKIIWQIGKKLFRTRVKVALLTYKALLEKDRKSPMEKMD